MEEDIKVLEEFIQGLSHYGTFEKEIQAIENLIKRNKELEKQIENITALVGEPIRNYITTTSTKYITTIDYIPKSKVREKIDKDINTNEHTILGGRRNGKTLEYGIRLGRIQMCEELLQEGDE